MTNYPSLSEITYSDPYFSGISLHQLPSSAGSKLILVSIDASSETDALDAIETLKSKHGINKIDTVISKSSIVQYIGVALHTLPNELKDHFEINTIAHLRLFQAT